MDNFKYENITNRRGHLKKLTISLTGEYSHEALIELGQGSFNIGVKGIDDGYVDVWVNKDDKIRWNSFNGSEVIFKPFISKSIKWPRFFSYTGNDIGFIEWSRKRKIEEFSWKPQKSMKVDFTDANINNLFIKSNYKLYISFGDNISYLDLYGNPNNFIIEKCLKVPSLGFYPKKDDNLKSYYLPDFKCFYDAEELSIEVEPNGAPFDCNSLLQFPNLKLLHLFGNMTNLSSLKNLKKLKKLGFWNVPELDGLPPLENWKELNRFVAMNIDETVGKRLKEEIKELKKQKDFEFISVSKLRNKIWFETEYGLPFSSWSSKDEKKAMSIYKRCLREIKKSKSKDDIKNSIINFTNNFNEMDNIESVHRDDIYSALCILMKNSPVTIQYHMWLEWFDKTRIF